MSNVNVINASEFQSQVEQGGQLTLVDFYADWCGPCKMIAPVLDDLADEYQGKINIVKIDADAYPEVPTKYGVRGFPTLMMFKDGAPLETTVGAQPHRVLKQFIEKHVQ